MNLIKWDDYRDTITSYGYINDEIYCTVETLPDGRGLLEYPRQFSAAPRRYLESPELAKDYADQRLKKLLS